MKYEVLTADKVEGETLEDARIALASQYPEHKVEVFDSGNQLVARVTKLAGPDEEEEDEAPAPSGKKPPFLEKDDNSGDDEPEEKAPPKKKPADDEDDNDDDTDDGPKDDDKDDLGFQDPDAGTSDVVKALKAFKTLVKILPKLEDQLKSLNGGSDAGADDLGPGGPGGPDGLPGGIPGGPPPGGPGAVPPPPGGPPKGIGPTPGAPPSAALPGGPGGMKAPNVNHGLDMRKGPQVGPSTFANVQDKMLYRPVANADGTRSSLIEASQEIAMNPRFANYYVHEIKYDEVDDQWVAHLKSSVR